MTANGNLTCAVTAELHESAELTLERRAENAAFLREPNESKLLLGERGCVRLTAFAAVLEVSSHK